MADTLYVVNQSLNRLMLYWKVLSGAESQKVALFKNDVAFTQATVMADLTEADFPGYARQTLTWNDPELVLDRYQMAGFGVTFTQNADDDPQTIYGYYTPWTAGGGNNQMMFAVKFETPVVFENEGDFLDLTPRISLGPFNP